MDKNRFRNFIRAAIGERTLTNKLTFVLHQNGVARKMAKILFRPGKSDIYIALPYLHLNTYHCGVMIGTDGKETVVQADQDSHSSRIPVKLSYHESGQVHLRPESGTAVLAKVQAVPIAKLSGQHIFTLELEGIDAFAPAKDREIRLPSTIAIALPQPAWRAQIIGYAGYSYDSVCGKYPRAREAHEPTFCVRFVRETLPALSLIHI